MISEAARNERRDHRDHPIDVALVGRGGKFIRAFDPQCFDILEERLLELLSEFPERNFRFARAANRLVIHVGDIHDAMHLVTAQFEMPLKQILEDIRTKVADMRAAVNSRPARVDVDLAACGIARLEVFEFAGVRVKKTQRHLILSCRAESRDLSFFSD